MDSDACQMSLSSVESVGLGADVVERASSGRRRVSTGASKALPLQKVRPAAQGIGLAIEDAGTMGERVLVCVQGLQPPGLPVREDACSLECCQGSGGQSGC